jgi:lysophospholipase L1-like esterase
MTMILKIALIVASLGFLLGTHDFASAAPLLMLAGALAIWWLDQQEPPRLFAWAAILTGTGVAMAKEAPFLVAGGMAAGLLVGLEWLTRRQGRDDPSGSMLLVGLVAAGGLGFFQFQSASGGGEALVTAPKRIVAVGDSLTSGLPGEGFQRWPDLVAAEFGASAVNLSYPGDTASESLDRWSHRLAPRQWNSADPTWEPDLVVVVIGGNDIRRRGGKDQLRGDIAKWAETLKARNVPVLLVSVPGGLVTDEYSGVWREVAAEYGLAWMNESILRTIFTTPALTSDGIHFNADGHRRFAEAVAKRIRGG